MFQALETPLMGCLEIRPRVSEDTRGRFVKTFHQPAFQEFGLDVQWAEEYYSVSHRGVLRGLHFQLPPHDHEKLVYCVFGEVLDAAVDLRLGSPTYGQHVTFRLDAQQATMIYLPRGLAHGFFTLSEKAILMYKVSSVYSPQHDAGIRWDTAGIQWPVDTPVLSDRDQNFPALKNFSSPFTVTI